MRAGRRRPPVPAVDARPSGAARPRPRPPRGGGTYRGTDGHVHRVPARAGTTSSRSCACARTWRRRPPPRCRRSRPGRPAGRASSGRSRRSTRPCCRVVEAVVALGAERPVTAAAVRAAVAGDDTAAAALVDAALADAQGPGPDPPRRAGARRTRGPGGGRRPTTRRCTRPRPAEFVGFVPGRPAWSSTTAPRPTPTAGSAVLDDPAEVRSPLQDALAGARQVIDAPLWGPPWVPALTNATATAGAVQRLLRRGLPRARRQPARRPPAPRVVLALRGGRTHRARALSTVPADAPHRSRAGRGRVGRGGRARRRLVARLATCGSTPAPVLRSGGLGVRETCAGSRRRSRSTRPRRRSSSSLAGAAGLWPTTARSRRRSCRRSTWTTGPRSTPARWRSSCGPG